MLVLSRKSQESIVIDGGRIVVKVLSAKGKAVRIGIQADREVSIRRGELAPADHLRGDASEDAHAIATLAAYGHPSGKSVVAAETTQSE